MKPLERVNIGPVSYLIYENVCPSGKITGIYTSTITKDNVFLSIPLSTSIFTGTHFAVTDMVKSLENLRE